MHESDVLYLQDESQMVGRRYSEEMYIWSEPWFRGQDRTTRWGDLYF